MFKRAMLLLLALMMVPCFASAAVYWQINATTSPAALKPNLTVAPPALPGDYTTTVNLTKVTSAAIGSVNFNVAAVSGYTVRVKVDGVQVAVAPGTVTVPKGTVLTHSVVAYYTPVSTNYVVTTIPASGGYISPSVTATGTNPTITVTPSGGYTLTGVKIDGGAETLLGGVLPAGVTMDLGGSATGADFTFTSAHSIQGVFVSTVVVPPPSTNLCLNCHNGAGGPVPLPLINAHINNTCVSCHDPAGNLSHAYTTAFTCTPCHNTVANALPATHDMKGLASCNKCHNVASAHTASAGCVDCHDLGLNAGSAFVQDNNGVRSIMNEFTKRSHHITGAAPTNAQCAVCHLEGKVVGTAVVVDTTKHMVDNKIHLRNADDNSDFVWSGTEHTNMDNFCFSCHDSNGAAAVPATFAGVTGFTGIAANPFGDTLTNTYDLVARAGVVDVKTAFTSTNASHHAVSGQRYKYRFSTVANAAQWAARTHNPMPAASEIAVGHLDLDGQPIEFVEGEDTYDMHGPEEGGHATLYEGDKFVATYIPLGATQNVADNSLLHCGDCHTVGQWKVGSSTNADGSATPVAIGAHGSANEYLLRNSLGTDAIHNGLTYVCFNCHQTGTQAATAAAWAEQVAAELIADSVAPVSGSALNPLGKYIPTPVPTWKAGWNALHPTVYPGQLNGYATAHAVSAFHAQCQADSADNITSVPNRGFNNFSSNRLQRSWSPQAVKAFDYSPASGATATAPLGGSNAASGNITGIACTNCHNSGLRNSWGGIHGGNNTYTDGLGRTQTTYRFMPGMGNYRYAPPGGWDGKDVSDPSLLTINNPLYPGTPGNRSDQSVGFPGASGKPMGGCYTNGGAGGTGSDLNNAGGVTYGVCNHHGTSTAASAAPAGRPASFRTTYGGGSTGNPTTFEPTVREATSGGTLVTRPLKY